MTYYYTHRSVPCSAFTREASSCSGWEITQKHVTGQCAESRIWQLSVLTGMSSSNPAGLGDLCRRGDRGDGWLQGSSAFQTHQDRCANELTRLCVVTRTRPAWVQARQGPSTERRNWAWGPTASQEATDNGYLLAKGKSVLSSLVLLGISTTLQGRTYAREQLVNKKQAQLCFRGHFKFWFVFSIFVSFCFIGLLLILIFVFLWSFVGFFSF